MNVEAMLEMMCLFLFPIGSRRLEGAIRISTLLTGQAGVILSAYHGALTKNGFYKAERQWRYDHSNVPRLMLLDYEDALIFNR